MKAGLRRLVADGFDGARHERAGGAPRLANPKLTLRAKKRIRAEATLLA